MFRLLFLPVTLAFWLLFALVALPFILLRFTLRLIATLVLLPIVFLVTLGGLLVGGLAVSLVFFLPLFCLAFLVWAVLRLAAPRPIGSVRL